jgi:hypothetical protein
MLPHSHAGIPTIYTNSTIHISSSKYIPNYQTAKISPNVLEGRNMGTLTPSIDADSFELPIPF